MGAAYYSYVRKTGAGLLVRSFARLLATSPGFRPEHVVTAPLPDRFHHPHVDPSPSVAALIAGPKPYGPYNGFPLQARGPYQSIPYSSSSFAAAANAALARRRCREQRRLVTTAELTRKV